MRIALPMMLKSLTTAGPSPTSRSNVVRLDERTRRLAKLRRFLAQSGRIHAAQQARVQELRAAGHDTRSAKSVLINIEELQLALFDLLAQLEQEQTADGSIVRLAANDVDVLSGL